MSNFQLLVFADLELYSWRLTYFNLIPNVSIPQEMLNTPSELANACFEGSFARHQKRHVEEYYLKAGDIFYVSAEDLDTYVSWGRNTKPKHTA